MGHIKEIDGDDRSLGLDVDFGPFAASYTFTSAESFLDFARDEVSEWNWLAAFVKGRIALFMKRQWAAVQRLNHAAIIWSNSPRDADARGEVIASIADFITHKAVISASTAAKYIVRQRGEGAIDPVSIEIIAAVLAGLQGTRFTDFVPRLSNYIGNDARIQEAFGEGVQYRKVVPRSVVDLGNRLGKRGQTRNSPDRDEADQLLKINGELKSLEGRLEATRHAVEDTVNDIRKLRDHSAKEADDQIKQQRDRVEELRALTKSFGGKIEADAAEARKRLDLLVHEVDRAQASVRDMLNEQKAQAVGAEEQIGGIKAIVSAKLQEVQEDIKQRIDAIEHAYTSDIELKAAETYWLEKLSNHMVRTGAAERIFYLVGVFALAVLAAMAYGLAQIFTQQENQLHSMVLLAIPAGILAWVMRLSHREVTSNRSLQDDASERIAMIKTFTAMGLKTDVDATTRKKAMDTIFRPAAAPPDDGSPATLIEALGKIAEKAASKIK